MESCQDFIKRKNKQFEEDADLIPMKDIGRKGRFHFKREAWVFLPQSNLDKKVFILERLRKIHFIGQLAYRKAWQKDEIEYRIGYFIVGRIGRARNRWIWGQFCPLIPHKDLNRLLEKARREKVLL